MEKKSCIYKENMMKVNKQVATIVRMLANEKHQKTNMNSFFLISDLKIGIK